MAKRESHPLCSLRLLNVESPRAGAPASLPAKAKRISSSINELPTTCFSPSSPASVASPGTGTPASLPERWHLLWTLTFKPALNTLAQSHRASERQRRGCQRCGGGVHLHPCAPPRPGGGGGATAREYLAAQEGVGRWESLTGWRRAGEKSRRGSPGCRTTRSRGREVDKELEGKGSKTWPEILHRRQSPQPSRVPRMCVDLEVLLHRCSAAAEPSHHGQRP
jgi:hypothetical protein